MILAMLLSPVTVVRLYRLSDQNLEINHAIIDVKANYLGIKIAIPRLYKIAVIKMTAM